MDGIISVKHSFNCGDLITILPGLRQISRETGKKIAIYQRLYFPAFYYVNSIINTRDDDGNSVCMNHDLFYRLKPLIESQDYIASFEIWDGQPIELDFDITRDSKSIPMPSGLIHSWGEAIFPQMATDLSEKWLSVESQSIKKDYYKDKVIINRTHRYYNPYNTFFFLGKYQDKILFSGTELEHIDFCKQWNLEIEYIKTDNFYQLAQIISWCKFGIFNQSLHWHIADALKTKRILELCPQFPNTFVTGANGYQFYQQKSLEFSFQKLISE